jgi:hypothetical protein
LFIVAYILTGNDKDFGTSTENTASLWFRNGIYTITCKEGYQPKNNDVACVNGILQGEYPKCVKIPGNSLMYLYNNFKSCLLLYYYLF